MTTKFGPPIPHVPGKPCPFPDAVGFVCWHPTGWDDVHWQTSSAQRLGVWHGWATHVVAYRLPADHHAYGPRVSRFTQEPDETVLLGSCGAARMRVRVFFKPEKMRCHGSRDGECSWVYCPQERDGEPWKSGRHCPYDHWCHYCGADQTGKKGDCDEC